MESMLYFHGISWEVFIIYASVNKLAIGSYNGLSPVRRQAIIWTNAALLLTGPVETVFT